MPAFSNDRRVAPTMGALLHALRNSLQRICSQSLLLLAREPTEGSAKLLHAICRESSHIGTLLDRVPRVLADVVIDGQDEAPPPIGEDGR